ncbi:MAG: hypothetical protein ACREB8_15255 [Pseudolabrys sp.]
MRPSAMLGARWAVVAFVCALATTPVAAQEAGDAAAAVAPVASEAAGETQPTADAPLTADETTALGNALVFDPTTFAEAGSAKPPRLSGLYEPPGIAISHTDKPDGSGTLVVKPPLDNDWDAKLGADLKLTTPQDGYRPGKPFAADAAGQDTGAAWASFGLTDVASLDARVDPACDQGKLATTFKHSIPLGGKFSVTVQDSYSVTEMFGPSAPAPSDVPLMTAPPSTAPPTPQVWGNQKTVKFDILASGTTLGATLVTASNDPVTHSTLSAEQKLFGPLHVTTAITDVGQSTSSKSVTASLRLNW